MFKWYMSYFFQAKDFYSHAIIHNPKDESAYLNRAITKVSIVTDLVWDNMGCISKYYFVVNKLLHKDITNSICYILGVIFHAFKG